MAKKKRPGLFSRTASEIPMATYNTGSILDLIVGRVYQGVGGKWYVDGGLGNHISGLYGVNNCFKSTFMDGLVGRITGIYDANTHIVDTEGTKDETLDEFITRSGDLGHLIDKENVTFTSGASASLEQMMETVKQACLTKEQNKKDFIIDTPFVDILTGKPMKAWVPTIIYPDSWSEATSDVEGDLFQKEKNMSTGKTKMWAMVDGGEKTKFIRLIRKFCELYGLVVCCTAHTGNNASMEGSMSPPQKKSQHMQQNESMKNVGSKFYPLTKTLMNVRTPKILQDSNGKAEYCLGDTPDVDINQVTLKMIRCKSNMSGVMYPLIFSQKYGFLPHVTNYHFMRQNGYQGLLGSKQKHACAFKPDVTLTRNTVRKTMQDNYEVKRAIELCGQFVFLCNYWCPSPEFAEFWKSTPEKLWETVVKKQGKTKAQEILNTRGYWLPEKDDREYMSIFDVMELAR